jgi:4-hydroxybenzoate polyprenyltransferase
MVLFAYLRERFPPVAYALLVAFFHGAASLVAVRLGGGEVRPWAGVAIFLAFFHLRVFDEHKDYARDCVSHPERLLSRGVVTLRMLKIWGAVAVAGELAIAQACGRTAAASWAAMFVFTVLMRVEFGLGAWLNRHILTYALTHNPVVALLALFAWSTTGASWDPRYLLFVLAVSLGSLSFEIARKTRLPAEEVPGVDSYSSVHGRRVAASLVYATAALGLGAGVLLNAQLSPSLWPLVPMLAGLVAVRLATRAQVPARRVEAAASLGLLGLLGGVAWAAW